MIRSQALYLYRKIFKLNLEFEISLSWKNTSTNKDTNLNDLKYILSLIISNILQKFALSWTRYWGDSSQLLRLGGMRKMSNSHASACLSEHVLQIINNNPVKNK